MLRSVLLGASKSERLKDALTRAPVTQGVVERFVAGETTTDAVAATRRLRSAGLQVTIDHLGEDTTDEEQATRVAVAYLDLLSALSGAGLSAGADVSLKLSALGQFLGTDGERIALDNARTICAAAHACGATVTLDAEDHTTTDATLGALSQLRKEFPSTGAVLQAYLHRTESDCRDLAVAGSRVRLCKGAYAEPDEVAFTDRHEVDKSYVRCLRALIEGPGYPMVASHDPRLIAIAEELITRAGRRPDSYEFQMLYGIRPNEQQRLATAGHRFRVYLPYGNDWYGYLVRRLAERPANLTFFARSLVGRH